ncbi:MAG: Maf family protein [Gammaproteobacteria bacterium]|nr:Maf family protein [Gammaproteobacteria bacterium]
MMFPQIYLASNSPRRRELLTQIGVNFSMLSVDVDERRFDNEPAVDYVQRVAIAKAQAGWDSLNHSNNKPVLGSDTSVVLAGDVLGKPSDDEHAREMLQRLSGQQHQVMTAVAIVTTEKTWLELNTSTVTFAKLTADEIDWYLSTKEGVDKAGGYAVQGLAALFIEQIEGSYSGIMGLPLRETGLLLTQIAGRINE